MTLRPIPSACPKTDGQLFDRLTELFGIGEWDDSMEVVMPYWKYRAREVSKVKTSRIASDKSIPDLYMAALYCKAHGFDIRAVSWLHRHVRESWAWWNAQQITDKQTPPDLYGEAIRQEADNPDNRWLNRLIRAAPAYREETYQAWLKRDRASQ